ncbi:unannotated protein [freshwater metagenome]|uniref:Unannotated protein n=1 Tax=freshwater metagenome TaxID=449393 RepID=A0A6J7DIT2_9ZZZZ|nr:hypothetical protein [Actinomycetota bacterium]
MTTNELQTRPIRLKQGVALYASKDPEFFFIGTPRTRVGFQSKCARAIFEYFAANAATEQTEQLLQEILDSSEHTSVQISELTTQLNDCGLIESQQSKIRVSERYISAITEKAKVASAHKGDASFEQLKKKIEPELIQSRWVPGVIDSGIEIINQRHLAHVEISGHSRAATQLFALLLASGVTHTQFGLGYRQNSPLITDTDIEAGSIRSTDLGKTFKARTNELSKEISLLPLDKVESAQELEGDFKEQTLKIHFGEIDPVIRSLWMSAGQQHLIIGEVEGACLTLGPIVKPGQTPCNRCVELLENEQSEAGAEIVRTGETTAELPVVGAHFLSALVASIVIQLIDTGTCDLMGSIITVDLLSLCSAKHIAIARHPSCGCNW